MKKFIVKIALIIVSAVTALCGAVCLSACRESGGGGDKPSVGVTEVKGTLYGKWNDYDGIKVGFADADVYASGNVDERKILPELDCLPGEKFYMIVDFSITAPYDNDGRESVTAEVKVSPFSVFSATVQETNSGNVTEETANGETVLRAVYTVPDKGGSVRNMRLAIQLTAKEVGVAEVTVDFENSSDMQAVASPDIKKTALAYSPLVFENATVIYSNDKNLKRVVIPRIYGGDYVTGIGPSAFSGYAELADVYIPDNVKKIDGDAFKDCAKLGSIRLPEELTSVGETAFSGCVRLTEINIPSKVNKISEDAFKDCHALKRVTVAENNGSFLGKDGILYDKPATKFLFIPNALEGDVEIPDGVTALDNYAFMGRSRLTGVRIPSSVTLLGSGVFRYCSSITEIRLPEGIRRISDWSFDGCSSLTDLYLPDSVQSIGFNAFGSCSSLKYNEENGAKYLGGESNEFAFLIRGDYSITECKVNEKTKIVYDNAFANCPSLASVTLPDGLEIIGEDAFERCVITEIVVPDSVKEIGEGAFNNCEKLVSLTVSAQAEPRGYILEYCASLKSITFKGTKKEWEEVELKYIFNSHASGYAVHCSDGDV